MKLDVCADSLAALMVLEPELEPVPEPFRMQPQVTLIIGFDEYLKFVSSLSDDTTFLNTPTTRIQTAIATQNEPALLRYFYTDVALAVCKELAYAEVYGKQPTAVRHTFTGCTSYKSVAITDNVEAILRQLLTAKGFALPKTLSRCNEKHWAYASKLIQDALKAPTRWVEKC